MLHILIRFSHNKNNDGTPSIRESRNEKEIMLISAGRVLGGSSSSRFHFKILG